MGSPQAPFANVRALLDGNRVLFVPALAAITMSRPIVRELGGFDQLPGRFRSLIDTVLLQPDVNLVPPPIGDALTLAFNAYMLRGTDASHGLEYEFAGMLDRLTGETLCTSMGERCAMSHRRGRLSIHMESLANAASSAGTDGAKAFWDFVLGSQRLELLGLTRSPETITRICSLIERTITDTRVNRAHLTAGAERLYALTTST